MVAHCDLRVGEAVVMECAIGIQFAIGDTKVFEVGHITSTIQNPFF